MAAIRGSSLPITVTVAGVDLTGAAITMVFAKKTSQSPLLTKTKAGGHITVAYNAGTGASTLTLTLSAAETATWNDEIAYAIYIDDGSTGGDWIPDNGGIGAIQFTDSVKKA